MADFDYKEKTEQLKKTADEAKTLYTEAGGDLSTAGAGSESEAKPEAPAAEATADTNKKTPGLYFAGDTVTGIDKNLGGAYNVYHNITQRSEFKEAASDSQSNTQFRENKALMKAMGIDRHHVTNMVSEKFGGLNEFGNMHLADQIESVNLLLKREAISRGLETSEKGNIKVGDAVINLNEHAVDAQEHRMNAAPDRKKHHAKSELLQGGKGLLVRGAGVTISNAAGARAYDMVMGALGKETHDENGKRKPSWGRTIFRVAAIVGGDKLLGMAVDHFGHGKVKMKDVQQAAQQEGAATPTGGSNAEKTAQTNAKNTSQGAAVNSTGQAKDFIEALEASGIKNPETIERLMKIAEERMLNGQLNSVTGGAFMDALQTYANKHVDGYAKQSANQAQDLKDIVAEAGKNEKTPPTQEVQQKQAEQVKQEVKEAGDTEKRQETAKDAAKSVTANMGWNVSTTADKPAAKDEPTKLEDAGKTMKVVVDLGKENGVNSMDAKDTQGAEAVNNSGQKKQTTFNYTLTS